jgi:AcrR family transcriptional regulator
MSLARILKEEEYNAKRNEILHSAQKLVYTKGYEKMTIQDVLNESGISKGSFFHYFSSKQALLEALIENFMDKGESKLVPIVENERMKAIEKLNTYFATASEWKTTQKEYLMAFMRVWYDDSNAIIRQKMITASKNRISPLLSTIILQGVNEGVFKPTPKDHTAEIIISLVQSLWDNLYMKIIANEHEGSQISENINEINNVLSSYTNVIENILGVPNSTIKIIDDETMRAWL